MTPEQQAQIKKLMEAFENAENSNAEYEAYHELCTYFEAHTLNPLKVFPLVDTARLASYLSFYKTMEESNALLGETEEFPLKESVYEDWPQETAKVLSFSHPYVISQILCTMKDSHITYYITVSNDEFETTNLLAAKRYLAEHL